MNCKYNMLLCVNSGYVGKGATECLGCERDRLKGELENTQKQLVLIGERAVVDWDDSTVGVVDKLVPDGGKYKDWLKHVLVTVPSENERLKRELEIISELAIFIYTQFFSGYTGNDKTVMSDGRVLGAKIAKCEICEHDCETFTAMMNCQFRPSPYYKGFKGLAGKE